MTVVFQKNVKALYEKWEPG